MAAGAVVFLGSFLLFVLELIAGKLTLPSFGGGAQVWTACMVFFQAALLAGYLYARVSTSLLRPRAQAALQLALLAAAAAACLPLRLEAVGPGGPLLRLLSALTTSIGLPFLAISSTVPVVQSWLESRRAVRSDHYVLYAASNTGALLGLLSYPFVLEPFLTVSAQLRVWTALYVLYAGLHLLVLPSGGSAHPEAAGAAPEGRAGPQGDSDGAVRPLTWVLLATGPSAALLAATRFLSDTLAAVPLLWVIPLAVYLGTFILAFKAEPFRLSGRALGLLAAAFAPLLAVLWAAGSPALAGVLLNVGALFLLAMICHGSLAASRPRLSGSAPTFYLCVSAGGLAGGLIMGVLVPFLGRGIGWLGLEWLVAGGLCLASLVVRDQDRWSRFRAFKPGAAVLLAGLAAAGWLASRPGAGSPSVRNF
ncbi:MAG: ferrichrome ABC transporter permease, partial [Elusimicrobiota bacterium]